MTETLLSKALLRTKQLIESFQRECDVFTNVCMKNPNCASAITHLNELRSSLNGWKHVEYVLRLNNTTWINKHTAFLKHLAGEADEGGETAPVLQ